MKRKSEDDSNRPDAKAHKAAEDLGFRSRASSASGTDSRCNDATTTESSTEQDDGGGGDERPLSYDKADAATLQKRRYLISATPSAEATSSSIVAAQRKKRFLYLKGFKTLNTEFYEWGKETEIRLRQQLFGPVPQREQQQQQEESQEEKKPRFYFDAAREYLRRARRLNSLYARPHGDVYTFGAGDCGQLGFGSDGVYTAVKPKLVLNLCGVGINLIACGGLHNVALSEDGCVHTWGCNDDGSLGVPNVNDDGFCPTLVHGFRPSKYAAFREKEEEEKKEDDEEGGGKSSISVPTSSSSSTASSQNEDQAMIWVAAGDCQTLTLSSSGRVYMFGAYKDKEGKPWRDVQPLDDTRPQHDEHDDNDHENKGQDFNAEQKESKRQEKLPPRCKQSFPIHVNQMPGRVQAIECGSSFNAAVLDGNLDKDNKGDDDDDESSMSTTLVTWGIGECGELARPVPPMRSTNGKYDIEAIKNDYLVPKPVVWSGPKMRERIVITVACGGYHLLAVARDGPIGSLAVFSSGLNNYGQLGLGDTKDRKELTRIEDLDGENIDRISGGMHHSLCLDSTGRRLFSFGRGDSGQLGVTDTIPDIGYCETKPVPVLLIPNETEQPEIAQVTCGGNHNLVLTDSGDVYSWGYGDMAALGHGKEKDEYRPRKLDIRKKNEGTTGGGDGSYSASSSSSLGPSSVVEHVAAGGQHSAIIVSRSGHSS